jgi:hypothetical protein
MWAWLILLVVFWQPAFWFAKAMLFWRAGKIADRDGYLWAVRGWFLSLWDLIRPRNA